MERILECNNIKMKLINTMGGMVKELSKGNYIVCADITGTGIITQDILFYDKKNNRIRFMLGKKWEQNFLNIYPVTGIILNKDSLENFLRKAEKLNQFNIKNYDFITVIEPKYIRVICDDFKELANIFAI